MIIPQEHQKMEQQLLKRFSLLQRQQQSTTIRRMLHLPVFDKVPEIKKLREHLPAVAGIQIKQGANALPVLEAVNRITQCTRPPFTLGLSGPIDHPVNLGMPHEKILGLYNPFSSVNHITGEMSLSVISGQNYNDFYGGIPYDPENGLIGHKQCGIMVLKVDLPVAYGYESSVAIDVQVKMPPAVTDIVELIPGGADSNLFGLVMADGFISMTAYYAGAVSDTTTVPFLSAGKTAVEAVHFDYQQAPVCNHSFMLPAGIASFSVFVRVDVAAYSSGTNDPLTATPLVDYALVDLRAPHFTGNHTIRRNFFSGHDHPAPGAVLIKQICISTDPYYYKPPDTH